MMVLVPFSIKSKDVKPAPSKIVTNFLSFNEKLVSDLLPNIQKFLFSAEYLIPMIGSAILPDQSNLESLMHFKVAPSEIKNVKSTPPAKRRTFGISSFENRLPAQALLNTTALSR